MLLCGAAAAALLGVGNPAFAQSAQQSATLEEVVVTAQKREQSLQDVPISVSAISAEDLKANRVASVMDLSTVAPNLVVHLTAGGSAIPAFGMRGVVSYGVVPGSDKEISIYIDGVYLGAARGSSFDLPDVERIEVLRGPQGTLFGRNATAGAVSIITRDPAGKFGIRQELTYGNYDQFRSRTRIDLPAWGPFTASVNYVHDERRGDIKNLGAGQVWDRTAFGLGKQTSPKWLGGKNSEIWFAALKFQPADNFKLVYKYDNTHTDYVPEGVTAVKVNTDPATSILGPAAGFLALVLASQPTPPLIQDTPKRPKAVNNNFTTPGINKTYGHNLTADLQIDDHMSIKNILAYRYTYNFSTYQLTGLGGLVNTIAALGPLGAPFVPLEIQNSTVSRQVSNEFQFNYDSKLATVTVGALYFHGSDRNGGPPGAPSNYVLRFLPGGVVPAGTQSLNYNYSTSKAAYVQAEIHVAPQVDVVGGYRITKDDKSGVFYSGIPPISFTYEKTKPAYSAGINYKPTEDILIYGKYSSAFVSGGAVGPVPFAPETAHSWEAGVKADLLDRRLRTNFSVFDVKYKDVQSAQGGNNVGHPELSTVVTGAGDAHAKGFEAEVTALPMRGLTLGGGLGYTDVKYSNVPAILITQGFGLYLPTLRPKWTSQMRGEYVTEPVFGESNLSFRVDANWRSKERIDSSSIRPGVSNRPPGATSPSIQFSPSAWLVNGRIALQHIKGPAGTNMEVALWGRNLNNDKSVMFTDITIATFTSTSYQSARTFGIDLSLEY